MVVDIQSNACDLFDPDIASTTLVDAEQNFLYCTKNLSEMAISTFIKQHTCKLNQFCALAGLKPID